MAIRYEKPPVWDRCIEAGLRPNEDTVFAYGDDIYVPGEFFPTDDVLAHEAVHQERQKDVKAWWDRYLSDPQFRFDEELLAFRVQYRFYCSKVKDRNARARYLASYAGVLAGPMYGKMMSFQDARKLISKGP